MAVIFVCQFRMKVFYRSNTLDIAAAEPPKIVVLKFPGTKLEMY
jgi:hypothetical protein